MHETELALTLIGCVLHRYGTIFKTSVVGRAVVVSADPDLNHYVFQQEGKLFRSWYPDTTNAIGGATRDKRKRVADEVASGAPLVHGL